MGVGYPFADGGPESRTASAPIARVVGAAEAVEDARQMRGGGAGAGIGDGEDGVAGFDAGADGDAALGATLCGGLLVPLRAASASSPCPWVPRSPSPTAIVVQALRASFHGLGSNNAPMRITFRAGAGRRRS